MLKNPVRWTLLGMPLDTALRRIIKKGGMYLRYPNNELRHYGPDAWPAAALGFTRWSDVFAIIRNPSLGLGDAYTAGRVHHLPGDLESVLTTIVSNRHYGPFGGVFRTLRPRPLNLRRFQRGHIAEHYDGDGPQMQWWYRRVLGDTMLYTCARYLTGDEDLHDAQINKVMDIGAKLGLELPSTPEEWAANAQIRLVDIGCGWGFIACYLAAIYGVQVHGITIAADQLPVAKAMAEEMEVSRLVTFELVSYQELGERARARNFERYTAGYSIGMFEHVPHAEYREYFRIVRRLLQPEARFLLHCITNQMGGAPDQFVSRRIFRGSRLGALWQIHRASAREGLYSMDGGENLLHHYVPTLQAWIDEHVAAKDDIIRVCGAEFWRERYFWLVASRVSFAAGDLSLSQILMTNGKARKWPWSRIYMYERPQSRRPARVRAI